MKNTANCINGIQEYLKSIGEYELLTADEEKQMFQKLREGNEDFRTELIQRNLKLVVAIAKKYKGWCGLSFNDLIQEGNFGLMTAVDKFDYTLGYKFSTYATYWIKQAISKAIVEKGRSIRLPAHIVDKVSKVKKAEKALAQELGRHPSEEEIANRLSISALEVKDIIEMSQMTMSLDMPVTDDDEDCLVDFIEDKKFETPTQHMAKVDLKEQLLKVMRSLDEREQKVLIKRYGLEDGEPMTLEEIGQEMNLSRERIRQIEEKALHKLRNPVRSASLKIYMADAA